MPEKVTSSLPYSQSGLPERVEGISVEESIAEDRARHVSEMYAQFKEIMAKPVIIPLHQFQRFLPLYRKDVAASIDPMNKDQVDKYGALSEELLKLVNPYKPYYVRTPDGKLVGFPPLFNFIAGVAPDLISYVDKFANILAKCPDQQWRLNEVTGNLINAIANSQDVEQIKTQSKRYIRHSYEFAQQMDSIRMAADGVDAVNAAIASTEPVTEEATVDNKLSGVEWVLD